jgi:hypothetical protein
MAAYDGPQVVGMDLHRRRSVLVRMTPDGQKLATVRIANSPERLATEIGKAGPAPEVVLEATYGGRPTRWPGPARRCIWRTHWG